MARKNVFHVNWKLKKELDYMRVLILKVVWKQRKRDKITHVRMDIASTTPDKHF